MSGTATISWGRNTFSVFELGRMRHLDLLALWHQLHPGDGPPGAEGARLAAASKETIAAAILASPE